MITTKSEAIELENELDALVSEAIKEKSTVSMALTGRLKINFGDNYISFERDFKTVDYIDYHGSYDSLSEIIKTIQKTMAENVENFVLLINTYENRNKLL